MSAITGVIGHVGGATAQVLLAAGARVRAVVHDSEKGRAWVMPVFLKMNKLRPVALFIATLAGGTMAGFFLTYGGTIMPGLATVDDRSFVAAFQGLERTFGNFETTVNWPVVVGFLGGPLLIVVAMILNRKSRPIVWLTSAAFVLSIATIVLTLTFNVPLNDEIKAAGDPNTINVTQVREDFREDWWRTWNWVRSATSTAAFACLAWALVVRGREDRDAK